VAATSRSQKSRIRGVKKMMLQFDFIKAWMTAQTRTERGASLVEYALLVALIAVVCIGAVTFLGNSAKTKFSSVGSSLG
jgi:pilus assembly protein Flp/PilA